MNFLGLIKNRLFKDSFVQESYEIHDKQIWNKYLSKKDFPYFISFPRTGSHWLRNVMELYFEKPSLMRVFFYKNPIDFTCFHIHDEDLSFNEKRRIIYLYRNPVETIYSQMNFYNEDLNDTERIKYWANLYGKHLEKWLLNDELSTDKVVLSYDNLKISFDAEFKKLSSFFNEPLNIKKLKKAKKNASKDKIKKKVTDDKRVIKSIDNYDENRRLFSETNSVLIEESILNINQNLIKFINK